MAAIFLFRPELPWPLAHIFPRPTIYFREMLLHSTDKQTFSSNVNLNIKVWNLSVSFSLIWKINFLRIVGTAPSAASFSYNSVLPHPCQFFTPGNGQNADPGNFPFFSLALMRLAASLCNLNERLDHEYPGVHLIFTHSLWISRWVVRQSRIWVHFVLCHEVEVEIAETVLAVWGFTKRW